MDTGRVTSSWATVARGRLQSLGQPQDAHPLAIRKLVQVEPGGHQRVFAEEDPVSALDITTVAAAGNQLFGLPLFLARPTSPVTTLRVALVEWAAGSKAIEFSLLATDPLDVLA
jgi:hypothetical protein